MVRNTLLCHRRSHTSYAYVKPPSYLVCFAIAAHFRPPPFCSHPRRLIFSTHETSVPDELEMRLPIHFIRGSIISQTSPRRFINALSYDPACSWGATSCCFSSCYVPCLAWARARPPVRVSGGTGCEIHTPWRRGGRTNNTGPCRRQEGRTHNILARLALLADGRRLGTGLLRTLSLAVGRGIGGVAAAVPAK